MIERKSGPLTDLKSPQGHPKLVDSSNPLSDGTSSSRRKKRFLIFGGIAVLVVVIVAAVVAAFIAMADDPRFTVTLPQVAAHAALDPRMIGHEFVDGAFWTITTEATFYFWVALGLSLPQQLLILYQEHHAGTCASPGSRLGSPQSPPIGYPSE